MTGCNDDQNLVAACRAGKTEAFGTLVRRYQDRLYPTVLRLAGCAEDAHDLLQEAFMRAFQRLGTFHGESSFYTWIYRIAVNVALTERRKRKRGTWRLREDRRGASEEVADDPKRTDPTLPLERSERDGQVQAALSALGTDHRAVVVMKDLDGLRYEEIAAILEVPIGTVRSRLHRARFELRERLRGILDDFPARPQTPDMASRNGQSAAPIPLSSIHDHET
jgi:RNA polymerase sigma-70 factor (ECF subfamily)